MMREILFRGKRTDNGEWVEGYYVKAELLNGSGEEHVIIEYSAEGTTYHVIPETVGQFTGLTDKSGTKIFEGDVVSGFFNSKKITGKIIYGSDAHFFIDRKGLYGIGLNNSEDWVRVIGNIQDNPELMEVEE